jgi:hypothetical protein
MENETIYDSSEEVTGFIAPQTKKASELEWHDVIIPAETQRYLDEEDGVLGGKACPPLYSVDDVKDNGRRIEVQVHALRRRKDKRTFYMDHDKEVTVILAKTMWSMRADESREEADALKRAGRPMKTAIIDGTPVAEVEVGDILATQDVQAFVKTGGMLGGPGCPPMAMVNEVTKRGAETVFTVQRLGPDGTRTGREFDLPFEGELDVLTVQFGATVHGIGPWGQA